MVSLSRRVPWPVWLSAVAAAAGLSGWVLFSSAPLWVRAAAAVVSPVAMVLVGVLTPRARPARPSVGSVEGFRGRQLERVAACDGVGDPFGPHLVLSASDR